MKDFNYFDMYIEDAEEIRLLQEKLEYIEDATTKMNNLVSIYHDLSTKGDVLALESLGGDAFLKIIGAEVTMEEITDDNFQATFEGAITRQIWEMIKNFFTSISKSFQWIIDKIFGEKAERDAENIETLFSKYSTKLSQVIAAGNTPSTFNTNTAQVDDVIRQIKAADAIVSRHLPSMFERVTDWDFVQKTIEHFKSSLVNATSDDPLSRIELGGNFVVSFKELQLVAMDVGKAGWFSDQEVSDLVSNIGRFLRLNMTKGYSSRLKYMKKTATEYMGSANKDPDKSMRVLQTINTIMTNYTKSVIEFKKWQLFTWNMITMLRKKSV